MRKLVTLASAVVLAASCVNCSSSSPAASSLVGPTSVSADAKKPGHGTPGGTIAVAMVTDANGNGAPDFGDQISFSVSTAATSDPRVNVTCYQSGYMVFAAAWPSTPIITLWSGAWTGGAADCTATLYYFDGSKQPVLATLDFPVGA